MNKKSMISNYKSSIIFESFSFLSWVCICEQLKKNIAANQKFQNEIMSFISKWSCQCATKMNGSIIAWLWLRNEEEYWDKCNDNLILLMELTNSVGQTETIWIQRKKKFITDWIVTTHLNAIYLTALAGFLK